MAHFNLTCKALKIDRLKKDLAKEKADSVQISRGESPRLTIKQKWQHLLFDCKRKLRRCFTFRRSSKLGKFWYRLRHYGSLENYILKSFIGFVGGFFLTYLFFVIFVLQFDFSFTRATVVCGFLGAFLMLGMAFSTNVRCILLLSLPTICSKRGRQALLAYAFVLTLTGPAKNYMNNMGILTESLACGQEQLKSAVRQILDVIKKPFLAIRDAIRNVVKVVKMVVKKIKEILIQIKRIIMALVRVVKAAFQFLGKILNICNKELGTPFERCARAFDNAITDCNAKLGPFFSWLCSIALLVKAVCYTVKMFDFVCMLVDFISNSVIGVIIRKIKIFVRHVRTMFYVRIKFSHSYHFESHASKSLTDVAHAILEEVKDRTRHLRAVLSLMGSVTSCFILVIFLRVMYYRYKFLTCDRFDNKYITREFRLIDMNRAKLGKETVLPLNKRERNKYITVSSLRLIKSEKKKLFTALVILGVTTLKIGCHMLSDYCLYWIMNLIAYHARFQSKVEAPNLPTVNIQGEGLLADLLKSIVNAFKPVGIKLEIDTVPCLPNPIPPDFDRYLLIGIIVLLCWILTVLEPYGLRLRQQVMCYYHPLRAKQRAIWLYNQIIRRRMSFLKFARRFLRRKIAGSGGQTVVTFKEWLRAKLHCKIFDLCLGKPASQEACLLCGEVLRPEQTELRPIRCQTPGCVGIYCPQCFDDLKNLCSICLSPIEYGDLSDISLEMGSDDEEPIPKSKTVRKPATPIKLPSEESQDEKEKLLRVVDMEEADDGFVDITLGDESDDYDYQYVKTSPSAEEIEELHKRSDKREVRDYASMESFILIEEDDDDSNKFEGLILRPFKKETADKATNTPLRNTVATSVSGIHIQKDNV